jgi:hypothetical protein
LEQAHVDKCADVRWREPLLEAAQLSNLMNCLMQGTDVDAAAVLVLAAQTGDTASFDLLLERPPLTAACSRKSEQSHCAGRLNMLSPGGCSG